MEWACFVSECFVGRLGEGLGSPANDVVGWYLAGLGMCIALLLVLAVRYALLWHSLRGDRPISDPDAVETVPVESPSPRPSAASVSAEPVPTAVEAPETPVLERLRGRLSKTQDQLLGRLDRVFAGRSSRSADVLEEIEEVLLGADLGVKTSDDLLRQVQEEMGRRALDAGELRGVLRGRIEEMLLRGAEGREPAATKPSVIMVIGVNGVGKTTTIGKLASYLKGEGDKVMLVAADTFRAAAIEQLEIWSERVGAELIKHKPDSDPSAVVFDAMRAARAREIDHVLVDTAGRLHTKKNLMEELKKVKRIMEREFEGAPHEVLLVLDATTGQNAIHQARMFHEALGVTGIVLTKLDGTAKGGVIVGITHELGLPVRYIGIGEQVEDLRVFDAGLFLEAIFGEEKAGVVH